MSPFHIVRFLCFQTRMQLAGEGGGAKLYKNTFDAVVKIASQEGIRNLYKGLSAGLFRQATYTTTRLGLYNSLMDSYQRQYNHSPNFLAKLTIGSISGT